MNRTYTLIFFIFLHFISSEILAQCPGSSVGPVAGTTFGNNASVGTVSWSNPSYVSAADGSSAAGSALVLGNVTNYLTVTGFGFSIPASATICGIGVSIKKSATGLLQNVTDNSVKIIKAGSITGTNHAIGGAWPGTAATSNYGNSTDLWGTTLTPADVNAGNFGIAIAATLNGVSVLPSARIDFIGITVYYSAPLPLELINFSLSAKGRLNEISWTTASENLVSSFSIERSYDGKSYQPIATIKAKGNKGDKTFYSFIDESSPETAYYRLKEKDINGSEQVFATRMLSRNASQFNVFPNPVVSNKPFFLHSDGPEGSSLLQVIDQKGQEIFRKDIQLQKSQHLEVDPGQLLPGIYFINLITDEGCFQKRLLVN